jgi:tetratricopeptide (TPR) repeat protein
MLERFGQVGAINFGDLPPAVDMLLQQGVAAYRRDPARADDFFRQALQMAPSALPVYYCLYKTHTYQGSLDEALAAAQAGLAEAACQAGWPEDWRAWPAFARIPDGAGRFALYTLKALAFIHLRRNEPRLAREKLDKLKRLDPAGLVGWLVIEDIVNGITREREMA